MSSPVPRKMSPGSRGRGWHLQLMIFSMFAIVSLSSWSQELSVTDGDRGGGREHGS